MTYCMHHWPRGSKVQIQIYLFSSYDRDIIRQETRKEPQLEDTCASFETFSKLTGTNSSGKLSLCKEQVLLKCV